MTKAKRRGRKPGTDSRTEFFAMRLSRSEVGQIKRAASELHRAPSALARDFILTALRQRGDA